MELLHIAIPAAKRAGSLSMSLSSPIKEYPVMNQKTQASDDKHNAIIDSTILEAQSVIDEFDKLLVQENSLLEVTDAQNILILSEKKKELVGKIAEFENQLRTLFQHHPDHQGVQMLKETLRRCQANNRSNQQVAQIVLKHTSNSLELLRSLQQMDDLSLYAASGELEVKREKRRLGSY
ncbi:MAG: hypothetical protein AB8B63_09520 [Granulosicoccus sp.]